jgi:hypothetical protein
VLVAAQVTPAQRAELDAYWRQRLRDEPAVRTEWKFHADRREAEPRGSRGLMFTRGLTRWLKFSVSRAARAPCG